MSDERDQPGPPPVLHPRDQILQKYRDVVQRRVRQITSDPADVVEVEVTKRARPKKKRTSNPLDTELAKAELKLMQFARKDKPTLLDYIIKDLDKPSKDRPGMTNGEELAEMFREQMKKPGSFQFYKEIIDRQQGKVPDKIQNEITLVQPNLPLMLDDFNRIATDDADDHPDDPETGRN